MNQSELAERFAEGATEGRASNVRIREGTGGVTYLVGYGHAVYAVRYASGKIVAYRNWYGYSPATSCQLTKMRLSHPADAYDGDSDAYEPLADQWAFDKAHTYDFDDL